MSTEKHIEKETLRITNDVMRQINRFESEAHWDKYVSGCDDKNEECEVDSKKFPLSAFYASKSHMNNAAQEYDIVMDAVARLIADTPGAYDKGSFIILQAEDMSVDAELQSHENGVAELPISFCGTYEKFDEKDIHVTINKKIKVTSRSLVFIVK